MKTKALAIFFVVITTCSYSQTLNLRVGPSISSLDFKNSMVTGNQFDKSMIGVDVLLGYDYLDFKYFNLSTNFGFIQKGGSGSILFVSGSNPDDPGIMDFKEKLYFLTVNTVIEGKLPIKDFIVPFIHAGPRLDYLFSYSEPAELLSQFEDINELNKYIYGVIVGGGIDFKIKKFKLGIGFDYYWNFNELVDYTAKTGVTNQISDKTFTLNFQVGVNL